VQFKIEAYPEHIRFSFVNYLGSSHFQLPLSQHVYPNTAQILVYTTESLREFGYDFLEQHHALDKLLRERPNLSVYVGASARQPEDTLPFLPWVNSAQILRSHPQYMEIAGTGSGIRYITYYSQEAGPLTDQRIFYTFQGVMASGAYYVSAIFPIKTGVLPQEFVDGDIDWDEFAANYDTFLADTFAQISSLPEEAFYPDLNTLDLLIQSITLETDAARWQMYTNVSAGYRFEFPPNRQICAFGDDVELIYQSRFYADPDVDHCAMSYQANPISILFDANDDAFQAFRAEIYPNSFVDYAEETISVSDHLATRISGQEIETGLPFELLKFTHEDSYLIFKAIGEENITVLNKMVSTLRFLGSEES
jgi:hypothetical protein